MCYQLQVKSAKYWTKEKEDGETHTIAYTPYGSGWVRARLDDLSQWEYKPCHRFRDADVDGKVMIKQQKRRRAK